MHWISDNCKDKKCVLCKHVKRDVQATHEVMENRDGVERHVPPAYICCAHFKKLVGPADAPCDK